MHRPSPCLGPAAGVALRAAGPFARGAALGAALLLGLATGAQAARVAGVSPQGEVPLVRQVRMQFDADVAPAGDPRRQPPAQLDCEGSAVAPAGAGHWTHPRQWVLDLAQPLAAGARCQLRLLPGWGPAGGQALQGPRQWTFSTGAPTIARSWPDEWTAIEEEQHFLLQLTGAVQADSVPGAAWCEQEGVGDRIGVRLVNGPAREALLARYRLTAQAAQVLLLACERPLAPASRVRLVWGAGIRSAALPALATRAPSALTWTVREPFQAEVSCERERAEAPCMPLRPLRVRFSADVPRALLQQVQLRGADGVARTPRLDGDEATLRELHFPAPLPLQTALQLHLPAGLKDESGRPLAQPGRFPLTVATGGLPPLAKFAAAPFGILEAGPDAALPLTVRQVQADLGAQGAVRILRLDATTPDAELLRWIGRVQRFHESTLTAEQAGLPREQWLETVVERDARGRERRRTQPREVASRTVPLLAGLPGVRRTALPLAAGGGGAPPAATEVLGLPLPEPGYHVVEVESRLLGRALLAGTDPMYVRTGVLATPLGVHFKQGREDSLVWVTSLARGRPVAGAEVAVNDCQGRTVWQGRTDAQGLARIARGFGGDELRDCPGRWAWFVTARHTPAGGGPADLAFVFSDDQQGIEPWRFNHPTGAGRVPDLRAHTVFDRPLLRPGETLSMKHFLRAETSAGLALPAQWPDEAVLSHASGDEVRLPLRWQHGSASSQWAIPATARPGRWDLRLQRGDQQWPAGDVRVETVRLPLVDARLQPPAGALIAPRELPLDVSLQFRNGGPLAGVAAQVSALWRERAADWPGYEAYSFQPPRGSGQPGDPELDDDAAGEPARIVADRLPLTTDAQGTARVRLPGLPLPDRPMTLQVELSYHDPNGEVQTASRHLPLWPSALVVGVQSRQWVARRERSASLQAVVLDTRGQPVAGRTVTVQARQVRWLSTRKRMVGGFYAYDQRDTTQDLGTVCEGRSDAQGRYDCEAVLAAAQGGGEVQLTARVQDDAGRSAQAGTSVWLAGPAEGDWFPQDRDDRIDVVPEQRELQPGQAARLQVRMPYRQATALVTVEREGILASRVVELTGQRPVVEVPVPGPAQAAGSWAPNVYVSVLVLRGRVRHVPWYSFFTWGWQQPADWWQAWRHEGPDHQPPGPMVDLAKPSFKLGVAALQVGTAAHRLDVRVQADRPVYGVRQTAQVQVQVSQHGQPVPGARVAFAAVDEALLALRPNTSWELLDALFQPHPWGVQTATAQGELIGRRHHGRKALPPGGGGGSNPTRELLDTLLLWQPDVSLDAQGRATLQVPLNDALTRFRLVAVADAPGVGGPPLADRFGTGHTAIDVRQDLQWLAGLPLQAREGDRFDASLTLRNTTERPLTLAAALTLRAEGEPGQAVPAAPPAPPARTLTLAPGQSQTLDWPLQVPAGMRQLHWVADARETGGPARDRLAGTLAVQPAVPVQVWQTLLRPLPPAGLSLPVAAPAGALPGQGGLQLTLQPRLAGALPAVRRYFETFPYTGLEQQASRAVGLDDPAAWARLVAELPGHLDADGLALHYPARPGDAAQGSDRLSAYLVSLAHEAGQPLPPALLERLLGGLTAFVEGRIERRFPAPRADLDVRKLAALEALSRHGRAHPRQLGSLQLTPAQWPTAALLDWWALLRRLDGVPDQARRRAEAVQLLRARLDASGPSLRFADETGDLWWWLMDSPDANAARLVLAALDAPEWRDEQPALLLGLLGRQQRGVWLTSPANAWGALAVRRFGQRVEAAPVTGVSELALAGGLPLRHDWQRQPEGATWRQPWPAAAPGPVAGASVASAPVGAGAVRRAETAAPVPAVLQARHAGAGQPWLWVQAQAAVPLAQPVSAGYRLRRTVTPVQQRQPGRWSRGDVMRVHLEVEAAADMAWVALSDPLPTGATVLGSGLGNDSALLAAPAAPAADDDATASLTHVERSPDAWRGVAAWLPRGRHRFQYTLRLNSSGQFALPPSRVEGQYAPASFGAWPNDALVVAP